MEAEEELLLDSELMQRFDSVKKLSTQERSQQVCRISHEVLSSVLQNIDKKRPEIRQMVEIAKQCNPELWAQMTRVHAQSEKGSCLQADSGVENHGEARRGSRLNRRATPRRNWA